jgi:uncharacterized membrane protein
MPRAFHAGRSHFVQDDRWRAPYIQMEAMLPLIVLVTVFTALVPPLGYALRVALAAIFLLTASADWGKRRRDLIRMTPPAIPRPDIAVTITGICEIAGALGLLISKTAPAAAIGLALLLIGVFPANVRAAREGIAIAGRPRTPIGLRSTIQIIFLLATIGVVIGARG